MIALNEIESIAIKNTLNCCEDFN